MTGVGFAPRALADIEHILKVSGELHGSAARRRYAAILAEAFAKIGQDPLGPGTVDRSELRPDLRSLHLRLVRGSKRRAVRQPVHVVFFRPDPRAGAWILRVLHERMEPTLHV